VGQASFTPGKSLPAAPYHCCLPAVHRHGLQEVSLLDFTWDGCKAGRSAGTQGGFWTFWRASGTQLSQRGKRILGHELAGLIERALN